MKSHIRFFRWAPRILCILAILLVSLFALDAFDPKLTYGQQLAGFAVHLLPSLVLVVFLFIAWKWELAGGMLFMILALGLSPSLFIGNYHSNHSVWMSLSVILLITFPFFIAGGLFIFSHFLKKKNAGHFPPEK